MTNTDITQVATKKDIQELTVVLKKQGAEIKSQRTDSKRTEKSLRSEILRVEGKVENLEEKIDSVERRLTEKLDKIANTLDGFVGTVDTLRTENIVGAHQTQELRTKVTNHEKRIIQLESYPHAA